MAENLDGTATCDRCGIDLPGYGVLHGMIMSDMDGDQIRRLIVSYDNNCRTIVLGGFVNYPGYAGVCASCGISTPRAVAVALVTSDLDPDDPTRQRQLTFCYTNGCAPGVLANLEV